MISCLILYHTTITSLTKCRILRVMFKDDDFEINVTGNNTVIIFIREAERTDIWQTAVNFESTNVYVGYGFGEAKSEAKRQANKKLQRRLYLNDEIHLQETIREQRFGYPSMRKSS